MSEVDGTINMVEACIIFPPTKPKVANQSHTVRDLIKCGEWQRIMASTRRVKGNVCGRYISVEEGPIYLDS